MKIKPLYIYISSIILVVIIVVVFTTINSNSEMPAVADQQMPQDDVHKGLQSPSSGMPSKVNVSQDIITKMETLKKEIEQNPNDTLKVREYADFLGMAHKPQDAVKLYNTILNKDPKRIDIYLKLTLLYYTQRDLDRAEESTKTILKYDSQNLEALYNLGVISAAKGDKEEAKEIWNNLIIKHPNTQAANFAKESLERLK